MNRFSDINFAYLRNNYLSIIQSTFGFVFIIALVAFVHFYLQPTSQPGLVDQGHQYSQQPDGGSKKTADKKAGVQSSDSPILPRSSHPVVTVEDGTSPNSFRATDDQAVSTWRVRLAASTTSCASLDYSLGHGYVEGTNAHYFATHNGMKSCFRSTNAGGDHGYGGSDVINYSTDTTAPTITVEEGEDDNSFKATDNEDGTTWHYAFIAGTATCGSGVTFPVASNYTEGDDVDYTDSHNTQKVCFRSVDASTNTSYALSDAIDTDTTPPTITVEDGTAPNSFKATDDDSGTTTWHYAFISGTATCGLGVTFPVASNYDEGDDVDYTDSHNTQKLCFRSVDAATNTSHKASDVIDTDDPPTTIVITIDTRNNTVSAVDDTTATTSMSYAFTPNKDPYCTNNSTHTYSTYIEGSDIQLDLSHDVMYICFKSRTASTTLTDSSYPDFINTKPPILGAFIKTDDEGFPTITGSYIESDADPDTFAYKLFDPAVDSCDAAFMGSGATLGRSVRVTDPAYNGYKACFTLTDTAHNVAYEASKVLSVPLPPEITTSVSPTTVTASDDKPGTTTTWHYVILETDDCDETTDFSDGIEYHEDGQIRIDQIAQAGKYFCFRSVLTASLQGFGSQLIPVRPIVTAIETSDTARPWGIGHWHILTVVFSEDVIVTPARQSRDAHLVTNAIEDRDSELHRINRYWSHSGNRVQFRYQTQRGAYTPEFLEVLEIRSNEDKITFTDTDGNAAVFEVPDSVLLSDNREIKIDGRVTSLTVTNPDDPEAWSTSKTLVAIDDYDDNNDLADNGRGSDRFGDPYHVFEYYLVPSEHSLLPALLLENDPRPIGRRGIDDACRLGDYRITERHSYIEGSQLVLGSEANDHYVCFRSRRADPLLHDSDNRDWSGVMSVLIKNIDSVGPVITFDYADDQVTPTVFDENGVVADSLQYKVVGITAECAKATLASDTTAYTSGSPVDVSEDDYYKVFCFGAADTTGNERYVAFYPFQEQSNLSIETITSTASDKAYSIGKRIDIRVAFTSEVTVTGRPELSLNSGGTAIYDSGSGGKVLSFIYTVISGENTRDLDVTALVLSGSAAIEPAEGDADAVLDLPAGNLATYKDITIDTVFPTLSVSPLVDNQVSAVPRDGIDQNPALAVVILSGSVCDGSVHPGSFTSIRPAEKVSLVHGQKACFKATDHAGNSVYMASITARDINAPAVAVEPAQADSAPKQSIVVSATSDDDDVDATSWIYKLIASDTACNQATMASGTSTGSRVVLNSEAQNNHKVCFRVSDTANNHGYQASGLISGIDVTKPVITISPLVDNQLSATVTDNLDTDPAFGYLFIAEDQVCNSSLTGLSYTPADTLSVPVDHKVCFIAEDNAGNSVYKPSITARDINAPAVAVEPSLDDSAPKQSIVVSATSADDDVDATSWIYKLIASDTACNQATMATGTSTGSRVVLNSEAQNNHKVCFRVSDTANNHGYQASGLISGIDVTKPVITISPLVDNQVSATVTDNLDTDPAFGYLFIAEDQVCNSSLTSLSYTPGASLDVPVDHKVCFIAEDNAGNSVYKPSITARDINAPAVAVEPAQADSAPKQSIVVSATSDDDDVDATSWIYKLIASDVACNQATMATGTSTGSRVVLNSEAQNNHKVCFRVSDTANNHGYQASGLISGIDVTKPVITISPLVDNQVSATVTDNLDTDPAFGYLFIAEDQVCNSSLTSLSYTPGASLDVPVDHKVCFIAEDNAGNSVYKPSITARDINAPAVAVEPAQADSAPKQSIVVSATSDDDDVDATSWIYKLIASDVACNQATMATGTSTGSRVVLNSEAHNNHKVCFRVSDTANNHGYQASGLISGIDVTKPVITISSMLKNQVSATVTDNLDTDPAFGYLFIAEDQVCNSSLTSLSYTPGASLDVPVDHKVCFIAIDNAGNSVYMASITARDINAPAVAVEPAQADSAPKQSIVVSATSDDDDVDATSWIYKLIASDTACNQATMTSGTSTGSRVVLNSEAQNNHKVCFRVSDTANNHGYQASGLISGIDVTKPVITISSMLKNQVSATVTDNLDTDPAFGYLFIAEDQVCNSSLTSLSYTPGASLDVPVDHKVCFIAIDNAGNSVYMASITARDINAPAVAVEPAQADSAPKQSIVVSATSADDDVDATSWIYKLIASDVACNQATMASGTSTGSRVVLNSEAQNNHKVCFRVSDTANNHGYQASGLISGIDVTKPVITISPLVDNQVSATVTDNLDTDPAFGYLFIAEDQVCNSSLTSLSYTPGASLDVPVDHKVCFIAIDNAGNATALITITGGQDLSVPKLSVKLNHSSRRVSASDDKEAPTSWVYSLINRDDSCDSSSFEQSSDYSESSLIPISAAHQNLRFCFRSLSEAQIAGYGVSGVVDVKAPSISVTTRGNQAQANDDDSTPTIWHYVLIGNDSNCQATSFRGTSSTRYSEGHTLTVKTTQLRRICFRSVDQQTNDAYQASDVLELTIPEEVSPQAPTSPTTPETPSSPQPPTPTVIGNDVQVTDRDNQVDDMPSGVYVVVLVINALAALTIIFLFWRRRQQNLPKSKR